MDLERLRFRARIMQNIRRFFIERKRVLKFLKPII